MATVLSQQSITERMEVMPVRRNTKHYYGYPTSAYESACLGNISNNFSSASGARVPLYPKKAVFLFFVDCLNQ